jgi:hypothetical protein
VLDQELTAQTSIAPSRELMFAQAQFGIDVAFFQILVKVQLFGTSQVE